MNKHWLSDDAVVACVGCQTRFTPVIRKHHCRVCGDIFCGPCSSRRLTVPALKLKNERACDGCYTLYATYLPLLKKEMKFIRYEKGKKSDVWLVLTEDEKNLRVSYDNGRKTPYLISLDLCSTVSDGQNTAVFQSHTGGCCGGNASVATAEPLCFSVIFTNETLDLQAPSLSVKGAYFDAMSALVALRHSRSAAFLDERKEQRVQEAQSAEQAAKAERQRLIQSKYSEKRDELVKKYTSPAKKR